MSFLERLGRWLRAGKEPSPVDALLVLDGAEFDLRLAAGINLLQRRYAPRLFVIQSWYHESVHARARAAASERPREIYLLPCLAVSTAQEAAAVHPILEVWHCASVMLVTSWYHTRRARAIFARRLRSLGIEVQTYPVAVPGISCHSWWKSSQGRKTIVMEAAKLVATGLHFDLPGPRDLRFRVKEWLHPSSASRNQEPQENQERKAA